MTNASVYSHVQKRFAGRRLWLLALAAACCLKAADVSAESVWRLVETTHTRVYLQSDDDEKRFYRSIRYPAQTGLGILSFGGKNKDATLDDRVRQRVDALYEKVQEILGMKKKMPKVNIRIFPDEAALHAAYEAIFKKKGQLRAWYLFEYHTIYLNVRDMSEGVLAHEMAHGVIDHYLDVRPPRQSAEILARYVDKHLFEDVNSYGQ